MQINISRNQNTIKFININIDFLNIFVFIFINSGILRDIHNRAILPINLSFDKGNICRESLINLRTDNNDTTLVNITTNHRDNRFTIGSHEAFHSLNLIINNDFFINGSAAFLNLIRNSIITIHKIKNLRIHI